jgi:Formate hydrogenlyase maturation protein HycH
MTGMGTKEERVVFYQLSRRFVQQGQAAPAQSKQLIHYTLALGHHIGVIDCFSNKLEIPLDGYREWIARLPKGEGRRKLEGLLRFGEIEITAAHTGLLRLALNTDIAMSEAETEWTTRLREMLQAIDEEPALYLMVRRRG